jgi:hypothetical protein
MNLIIYILTLNTASQGRTTAHKVIDFKTKTENSGTQWYHSFKNTSLLTPKNKDWLIHIKSAKTTKRAHKESLQSNVTLKSNIINLSVPTIATQEQNLELPSATENMQFNWNILLIASIWIFFFCLCKSTKQDQLLLNSQKNHAFKNH